MSFKSIRFSIYSLILFVLSIFAIVAVFKMNFMLGFVSILLILIPAAVQRKALDEANGGLDKFIAKFLVPLLAVIIGLVSIMGIAFWIQ